MPTRHDYEQLASELRGYAESYRYGVAWGAGSPTATFIGDGPVADMIDDHYQSAVNSLLRGADAFDETAAECDRRAIVCAEYVRARSDYFALPAEQREFVAMPTPPFTWVEC